jgi:hypothetical protein
MSCCLLSASSSSICHVPLPYLFSKIAQCLHICFAGCLRGASAWWWINKPVFLGRWTSFHIQILRMHKHVWSQLKQPAFPTCVPQVVIWEKNLFDCLTLTYVFWFLSKFPTLPIEEVNFPKRWPHLSCRSCCWTRQASALYLDRQHGSAMKFYEILQSIFRCFILFLISMKFYESILDDVRWC